MKKKGSIITNIGLGLLVAASLAACNNKKADTAAAPAASTTATSGTSAGTTAYVNTDTLLVKYDYAKDMSKRLSDKGKGAQSDVMSKRQAFQREVADYQKQMSALAADKRQETEQRLQRENQELQQYEQNATADFQTAQGNETSKLYTKIADFCKDYAKEKGYKLILTYSKTNPNIFYVDPSLDVTTDVVKRLNDAYAKEKK